MHATVLNGRKEIAKLLINTGADVNALNSTKVSPLDAAIHSTVCQIIHEGDEYSAVDELMSLSLADKMRTIAILLKAGVDVTQLACESLSLLREQIVERCDLELFRMFEDKSPDAQLGHPLQHEELMLSAVKLNRKTHYRICWFPSLLMDSSMKR